MTAAEMPDPACMSAGLTWFGEQVETAELVLRRPEEGDVARVIALAGDEQVARTTAFVPHPMTEAGARDFLARDGAARAAGGAVLAIERRARREEGAVGFIGVHPAAGGGAEIGYWVGRPYWGRGIATEAVRAVSRLSFRRLGLASLVAETMECNPASARVLEKAGFRLDGTAIGARGRCAGVPIRRYALSCDGWAAAWAARPRVLVAAAALLDADGRVLVQRRPEGRAMAGLWEFPGGKVGAAETPEAALVRELAEELSIDVTESCLAAFTFASHAYETFHLLMPLFVLRTWKGRVAAREGQALRWLRPVELARLPMPPADVPLVALLRDLL